MGIPSNMKPLVALACVLTWALTLTTGLRNETINYSCPLYNVDFDGHDFATVHATSWQKCGEICQDEKYCHYWTWSTHDNECWLKTSDAGYQSQAYRVSGYYTCH